jgi:hypothetical protein
MWYRKESSELRAHSLSLKIIRESSCLPHLILVSLSELHLNSFGTPSFILMSILKERKRIKEQTKRLQQLKFLPSWIQMTRRNGIWNICSLKAAFKREIHCCSSSRCVFSFENEDKVWTQNSWKVTGGIQNLLLLILLQECPVPPPLSTYIYILWHFRCSPP